MKSPARTTLFVDIGGVLLTNGWDHGMRKRAAETFRLDYDELNERHHLTFDTYEEGKLSLDEYLNRVVFYEKRTFSPGEFKTFMFQQSKPYPEMIEFIRSLKRQHSLKVVAVSNEGRELTTHRVEQFKLGSIIDSFVVSSFVHFRKPDADIYRIALDIAQVPASDVVYIEDRAMFVEVARTLGIMGVRHINQQSTRAALATFGLAIP
ncbi:MAG TPA: HAD family phosphatase [Bacteroidota bacterium]